MLTRRAVSQTFSLPASNHKIRRPLLGSNMSHRLNSIRHAVKALILTQFLVAGTAGAAPAAISPSVNAVDEGAVDPNSSMSAMILLNNPKKAAFDAAVASL